MMPGEQLPESAKVEKASDASRGKNTAWKFALVGGLSLFAGGGGLGIWVGNNLRAPTAAVYFSPKEGCTQAITEAINEAKGEILVQAYFFNSEQIADALIRAHSRGRTVLVILDRSCRNNPSSQAGRLFQNQIPLKVDDHTQGLAHNKVMIIDRCKVVTGSFNFTKSAEEKNAENLLILSDPHAVARYYQKWEQYWGRATPFEPSDLEQIPEIDPEVAKLHLHKKRTVKFTVDSTHRHQRNGGDLIFLNSKVDFYVMIGSSAVARYDRLS